MHRVLRSSVLSHSPLHQCRNNFTSATSNARLATEFNGLVIPSRQELLSQKSDSNAVDSPRPLSETSWSDPTIALRRAARLAREAAMATAAGQKTDGTSAPPDRRKYTSRKNETTGIEQRASRYQKSSAAPATRQVSDANRFRGLDALGQFTVAPAKNSTRDRKRREPRKDSLNASRRGRPGDRMALGKRVTAAQPPATAQRSGNINKMQEPSLELFEEGGEDPRKARLTIPENLSFNSTDIFGRTTPTMRVAPAPRRNDAVVPSPVKDRTKYMMEVIGGDYARYSPHVTQDYLTNPKELSAIKQAHITLSKNKEVDLNQKELLLRIVATLSSNKQIARASS